jgi:hypothetical protein
VTLRRALLLALVAYCASLTGCASMDVACNAKPVIWTEAASEGEVLLRWKVDPQGVKDNCVGERLAGCAKVSDGVARVWLTRVDECTTYWLSHELRHGLGARHD